MIAQRNFSTTEQNKTTMEHFNVAFVSTCYYCVTFSSSQQPPFALLFPFFPLLENNSRPY